MDTPIRGRVPVLYLAPWVDVGGSDKGTVDWFRFLDRGRFAPSLITTQPSPNRRLGEIEAYAEEVWELPQLMRGDDFPRFIFAFIESRGIRLVHIMNSRLGFELLPVMATLPERPRVVVQLHVEELDASGYVRYVTTRYGNLVDAFSVTSQALAERLEVYEVPHAKRRLIRTGVDAEREFSPARVKPTEGLDPTRLQILFAARLTWQKDPLLMVEVGAALRSRGVRFQLHVFGDGDLAEPVRRRIAELRLEQEILMHGESLELERWYAACDLVLLTSRFEGLPYVVYEAMAMGVPVIAPRLGGTEELVSSDTGVLVPAASDAGTYADQIAGLAGDSAHREQLGRAARARVLSQFSLEQMAAAHAALYDELLSTPDPRAAESREVESPPSAAAPGPARVAFRNRRPGSRPLVSVIVPCFNHGRYLPECLESVRRQDYERIETIIADDASTDPETVAVLDRIEQEGTASVMRLTARRGPGAARNAALERATGRFILPLDADNVLLPNSVGDLVEQLNNAGERIGFVYPNLQFTGNRHDYFEAPSYNLHGLLLENYCDTASLVDREVFDCGLRFADYAEMIHEDWDFVLSLAERGIHGEPARGPTLLFRKRGFTRSDVVHIHPAAADLVRAQHAELFADVGRIKAEWNPSLTLIALDSVPDSDGEALNNLLFAANGQTCSDFELIIPTSGELWPTNLGPRLRRVPSNLAASRVLLLDQGIKLARGGYILATYGSIATLLSDRALVEKLLRLLQGDLSLAALALADAESGRAALRVLEPTEAESVTLGALCWRTRTSWVAPVSTELSADMPLETLAMHMALQGRVQWRNLSRRDRPALARHGAADPKRDAAIDLGRPRRGRSGDARFQRSPAMLPTCSPPVSITLGAPDAWIPPQSRVLGRHLHEPSGRYIYTDSHEPPPECSCSHVLGALRVFPLPGTTPVSISAGGDVVGGETASIDTPSILGYVERVPLPLLDELSVGSHRQTGQRVLIAGGAADPLAPQLDMLTPIGFIEPTPIHPRTPPKGGDHGLAGLVRTVDPNARRHRYAAGRVPAGVPAGELGALLRTPLGDCDALWIDDQGSVFVDGRVLSNGRPSLVDAFRWIGAPLTWADAGPLPPKLRASARRAYDSTRLIASKPAHPERPTRPAGYLFRGPQPYTLPLYGGLHPVTGDQLLSTSSAECVSLGYRNIVVLGHVIARAPVTGRLGPVRTGAAWTSRFGMLTVSK